MNRLNSSNQLQLTTRSRPIFILPHRAEDSEPNGSLPIGNGEGTNALSVYEEPHLLSFYRDARVSVAERSR